MKFLHDEISIMYNLDHNGIVKMYEFGDDGKLVNDSGEELCEEPVVYIVMEYVESNLFS